MKPLRVAVIGGSGFIGSHLVTALLKAGHEPWIYDLAPSTRHPERVTRGDVCDALPLQAFLQGMEVVINLAAEHADDVRPVRRYAEVNVGGAQVLCGVLQALGIHQLVHISSVAVYGHTAGRAREDDALRPNTPYGHSKRDAEAVCRGWAAADASHRLLVVRPAVVFGPGNHGNVQHLIDHLRTGRFRMVGTGRNCKSMAYVGNLVDFLVTRLPLRVGVHTCNYADGPDLSTAALVAWIRTCLGHTGPAPRGVPYPLALLGAAGLQALDRLCGRRPTITPQRIRKFCAPSQVSTDHLQTLEFTAHWSLQDALAHTVRLSAPSRPTR